MDVERALRMACAGDRQRVADDAREYVAQLNVMDAPFDDVRRGRWKACGTADAAGFAAVGESSDDAARGLPRARVGADSRGERSEPLGLVSNATTVNDGTTVAVSPRKDRFLIDRDAKRIKRMRTTVGHVARLLHFDAHMERHAQRWNKKFITLTYRRGEDWRPDHMAGFRKAVWHWCRKNGVRCRYVWVAELQERGALHYHIILWLPKGKFMPRPDTAGWWPHGMSNVKTAQNPVAYIAKYASKTTTSQACQYPKGARMHGHAGLDPEARRHVRYWMAPIWVRDALSGRADIRKVSGGYMDKFTGEFLASPWRVELGPGGEVWAYRVDQQETMQ